MINIDLESTLNSILNPKKKIFQTTFNRKYYVMAKQRN
jgi:hypothetical protein